MGKINVYHLKCYNGLMKLDYTQTKPNKTIDIT